MLAVGVPARLRKQRESGTDPPSDKAE
jgi:hypothetical protein